MSRPVPAPTGHRLPFFFSGGFGWSTQTNGGFLATQGFLQMLAQILLFPWLSKKVGSLRTFWIAMALYPLLYLLAPYLVLLPPILRVPGLMLLLVAKVTFQSLSYPSLAIILTNSSPSKRVLGTLNGVAMSTASICRGFGPTLSGALDSVGDTIGMTGLAWWAIAAVALLGWLPGLAMKEGAGRPNVTSECDEESLLDSERDTDSVMTLTSEEVAERLFSK